MRLGVGYGEIDVQYKVVALEQWAQVLSRRVYDSLFLNYFIFNEIIITADHCVRMRLCHCVFANVRYLKTSIRIERNWI